MKKCSIEFEDLNKWKEWFNTGSKDELISAIEFTERFIDKLRSYGNSDEYIKSRKPFLDYAYTKMNERFKDWQEELIPF